MNYKLEKFWNYFLPPKILNYSFMNYKLEKFWNTLNFSPNSSKSKWTINLKSFEMKKQEVYQWLYQMNYKLEKFWNSNKQAF